MTESYNIAAQALELMDTINEGLNYLQNRLQAGFLVENHYLLKDIDGAVNAVNGVCSGLEGQAGNGAAVISAGDELQRCLKELDRAYIDAEAEKARFELQVEVLPAFKRWDELLRSFLNPAAQS